MRFLTRASFDQSYFSLSFNPHVCGLIWDSLCKVIHVSYADTRNLNHILLLMSVFFLSLHIIINSTNFSP